MGNFKLALRYLDIIIVEIRWKTVLLLIKNKCDLVHCKLNKSHFCAPAARKTFYGASDDFRGNPPKIITRSSRIFRREAAEQKHEET